MYLQSPAATAKIQSSYPWKCKGADMQRSLSTYKWIRGRAEREKKPRAPAGAGLGMGCQRESCKDGFDGRHGQGQEVETTARLGEKTLVRGLLVRKGM